jgi:hypothetical protein
MEENRIPTRVFYINLESTRTRGWRINRWPDKVREDGRIVGAEVWQEKVYSREEWKKLLRTARNRRILHIPMEWMNEFPAVYVQYTIWLFSVATWFRAVPVRYPGVIWMIFRAFQFIFFLKEMTTPPSEDIKFQELGFYIFVGKVHSNRTVSGLTTHQQSVTTRPSCKTNFLHPHTFTFFLNLCEHPPPSQQRRYNSIVIPVHYTLPYPA